MKVLLLTGSHPRHLHVARTLRRAGLLGGLLVEEREAFVPEAPAGLPAVDAVNFSRHFADRSASEERFFGSADASEFADLPLLRVTQAELNGEKTRQWVSAQAPDVVISYGIHIVSKPLLDVFPKHAWNIHGGLSPWYRGNVTLFWPFYFLKPNWTGMTIHQLTAKLDGGDIVHHAMPELVRGDGVHDVACRAVLQAAEDLVVILGMLRDGAELSLTPQKSSGKLFLSEDWKPQHLRVIYQLFDNDIVDKYLDGELGHHEPPLVRAFP